MKKIYLVCEIYNTINYAFELDEILIDIKKGYDVSVIYCDGISVNNRCSTNASGNKLLCHFCRKTTERILKQIGDIKIYKIKDMISSSNLNVEFKYSSINDIKKIEYNGAKIGYSVLSVYISATRNLYPEISNKFKHVIDKMLLSSLKYTDLAYSILQKEPDEVLVVNGRGFDSRSIVDICEMKHIHYKCLEVACDTEGNFVKEVFDNERVHTIFSYAEKIRQFWDKSAISLEEKTTIGSSFFEKKVNAVKMSDKVYVKNQTQDLLPKEWMETKTNVVIFNSSEDEFSAIGNDFDRFRYFDNQMDGIEHILLMFKNRTDIQFYLRIHPNLANIKYRYHLDLYTLPLKYDNLIVVPATSNISSYAMLMNCDKVIVFGSTMGIEAAYWGKPVMCLYPANYLLLNVCGIPKIDADICSFINSKENICQNRIDAIKYGYFAHNSERDKPVNNICNLLHYKIHFLFFRKEIFSMNFFCSNIKMYIILYMYLLYTAYRKITFPRNEKV